MLIKHLRDDNNKPFATVVAVDERSIGVAICCPKDNFNRKRGVKIASGRAKLCGPPSEFPNREVIKNGDFRNIGDIIDNELAIMAERANKYFWKVVLDN